MATSLENIDKSKVSAQRIEGLDDAVSTAVGNAITGAASTIVTSNLTANKVLVSDSNGKVAASSDALSNLVHKTGNETIGGQKTFTDNITVNTSYPRFYTKNSNMSRGTYSSSQGECKIIAQDKNGNLLAETRTYIESSDSATSYCIGVVSQNNSNEQIYKTPFRATTHKNGTSEISLSGVNAVYAPTPSDTTTTTGTQIATTGWVNTRLQDVGGSSRNIGEIVASTVPLTDAGLHLLDGSLIQGSGSYADFVTYIAGLVSSYPNLFVSEADWQTAITNYGVCGKFVYNSTNNTVRLPKITGFVEGTTDLTALGDLIEAGLPNITGDFKVSTYTSEANGAFSESKGYTGSAANVGFSSFDIGKTFLNASDSNPIYGNSSTVQPQAIKVLYYIVVANSTKTQIEVDIDEVMTDLAGKADTDLSNCTGLETVHVVTETYQNGTDWYRLYDDGWVEQGGKTTLNESSTTTVTYLKVFSDTNYTVLAIQTTQSTAGDNEVGIQFTPTSTTQGTLSCHYINPNTTDVSWYACGYTA